MTKNYKQACLPDWDALAMTNSYAAIANSAASAETGRVGLVGNHWCYVVGQW